MRSQGRLLAPMAIVSGTASVALLCGCGGGEEPEARNGPAARVFAGDLAGSTWTETHGWLAGAEGLTGDQRITLVLRMRSGKGFGAVQVLSFNKREAAGPVRCAGSAYDAGALSEATGEAGTGWFGVDDQGGTATLSIEQAVEVGPAPRAPPDCLEIAGRWTGASGLLRGKSGTFEFISPPGQADTVTRFR